MAQTKANTPTGDAEVTRSNVGVDAAQQPKATEDMSAKEVKESLAFHPDRELHPSSLKREADKSSAPNALDAEPHDPPIRTAAPDHGIRTLAIGAGAHEPPDPDGWDTDGRAKISGADKDGNPVYKLSGKSSQSKP